MEAVRRSDAIGCGTAGIFCGAAICSAHVNGRYLDSINSPILGIGGRGLQPYLCVHNS